MSQDRLLLPSGLDLAVTASVYPLPNRLLLSPRSSCGTARSCPSGLGVTGVCGREGGVTGSVSLLCSPPLKAGPQGLRPLRRPRTVLPGFGYPSFEPTCPERPRGAPQAVCSPGPRFPHLQNGGLEQRGLRPNLLMALQGFQGFPNSLACGDRSFAVGLYHHHGHRLLTHTCTRASFYPGKCAFRGSWLRDQTPKTWTLSPVSSPHTHVHTHQYTHYVHLYAHIHAFTRTPT